MQSIYIDTLGILKLQQKNTNTCQSVQIVCSREVFAQAITQKIITAIKSFSVTIEHATEFSPSSSNYCIHFKTDGGSKINKDSVFASVNINTLKTNARLKKELWDTIKNWLKDDK